MNRFIDRTMREQYDAAVRAYTIRHRDLFRADGSQNKGSSFASAFWNGFNGTRLGLGYSDRASRETIGYAYFRAGQDAAAVAKGKS